MGSHRSMQFVGNAPTKEESGLAVKDIKALEDIVQFLSRVIVDMCLNDERLLFAGLMNAE